MNLIATALVAALGVCLLAYAVYAGLTVWSAVQWRRAARPLDSRWTPPVTILKPVCGVDPEAYDNFVSFCRQDYPADRMQLIFGALDPGDPALELACRLRTEFPLLDIRVVAGDTVGTQGHNLKVRNLLSMLRFARHDLLVLCDSDMRVAPDYLRRIVAPFQYRKAPGEPGAPAGFPQAQAPQDGGEKHGAGRGIGMVTCPYRGHRVLSYAAALEAVSIGADFIPSTFVSQTLEGVGFALGSTIALPRQVLMEAGGFEAIIDELADDFHLGNRARQAGYTVLLSDYVVDDVMGQEGFAAMWARRLRWARTVRACRPAGYAGSLVTHGTALGLLFLIASRFHPYGWAVFGLTLLLRYATVLAVVLVCTRDPNPRRFWYLLPLSDLLQAVLFALSFFGNTVLWRGQRFRLLPGGKIVRLNEGASS